MFKLFIYWTFSSNLLITFRFNIIFYFLDSQIHLIRRTVYLFFIKQLFFALLMTFRLNIIFQLINLKINVNQ